MTFQPQIFKRRNYRSIRAAKMTRKLSKVSLEGTLAVWASSLVKFLIPVLLQTQNKFLSAKILSIKLINQISVNNLSLQKISFKPKKALKRSHSKVTTRIRYQIIEMPPHYLDFIVLKVFQIAAKKLHNKPEFKMKIEHKMNFKRSNRQLRLPIP